MRGILVSTVLGMGVVLGGCDFDDFDSNERVQADFHYNYPLKSGGSVSIETFNGSIEIVGWSQDTVDISGTKYAKSEQLRDGIKIETNHSDSMVTIRAVRPFENRGNMGARFVIHVPKQAELSRIVSSNGHIDVRDVAGRVNLRTSNGRINAEAVGGPVDAQTSNGRIELREVSATGKVPVHLETSNGSIEVTADKALGSDLHASTSNGSITVRLPAATAARVRASTSNSSISSEFDVSQEGRTDKHHLEGNMNNAHGDSPIIDLSTSNGSIRLLKM